MKLYLDNNCWGRKHDDQRQERMRRETWAVKVIIGACKAKGYCIVGSSVLDFEIEQNPKVAIRDDIMKRYLDSIGDYVVPSAEAFRRAALFRVAGLKRRDSYHLAVAEAVGVDMLITGDDKFERICTNKKLSTVKVLNPLKALPEVLI